MANNIINTIRHQHDNAYVVWSSYGIRGRKAHLLTYMTATLNRLGTCVTSIMVTAAMSTTRGRPSPLSGPIYKTRGIVIVTSLLLVVVEEVTLSQATKAAPAGTIVSLTTIFPKTRAVPCTIMPYTIPKLKSMENKSVRLPSTEKWCNSMRAQL